ncbi:Aste57867_1499 [Aphanomyces stellatus]|uniref:Aste57867_1499 protein n=1 Tax=Aphanomyces stellatus TaxID=120398 RepID=A0A485KAH0_9STRA|nr:hypothetical protein As57867_001498 [Aphanomyces stellatus]VFT78715.1 Aste57867_1499 [Aphanomyces stellatus]
MADEGTERVTTRQAAKHQVNSARTKRNASTGAIDLKRPSLYSSQQRVTALRTKTTRAVSHPGKGTAKRAAYPTKRALTIPKSPNLSKPRVSSVRKPYQPPQTTTFPARAIAAPKKRALTVPISPKLSKPRVPIAKAMPLREKLQPKTRMPPKKRPLTRPVSPKFTKRPVRHTTDRISATTKELLEIEAKKQEVMLARRKNQQYHQLTQGFQAPGQSKSNFAMTLRSAGVMGVPAIRRPKLTTFKEFHFLTDRRALEKQQQEAQKGSKRRATSVPDATPSLKRRRTIE